jgi:hypothetical protein
MDSEKKIDASIRILSAVITLATVIVGVWQFNRGQREMKEREIEQRKFEIEKMNNQASIETLTKFKEMQNKLYTETTSVISYLTIQRDHQSSKYKEKIDRFWQLYWVELSFVETKEVEGAMVKFGRLLQELQENNFADMSAKQSQLRIAGYEVAQAIKSSAKSWSLPEQLQAN